MFPMLKTPVSDDRKDGILEVGEELSGDEADPDYTEYMTGKKIPLGKYQGFGADPPFGGSGYRYPHFGGGGSGHCYESN